MELNTCMHISIHTLLTLSLIIIIILIMLAFPLTTSSIALGMILDPPSQSFWLPLHLTTIKNHHFSNVSSIYFDAQLLASTLSQEPHFHLYIGTLLVHCQQGYSDIPHQIHILNFIQLLIALENSRSYRRFTSSQHSQLHRKEPFLACTPAQ